VNIDWPIRRYFMNEALAPEAERILRDSTRAPWDNSPSEETHAVIVVVRVLNGVIVAEEVLVDGVPLEQLSEEALEAASPQP